jgi:hypothetical protein
MGKLNVVMRIVETFSRSRSEAPCLDRFVVTANWAAVFDGATPKSPDMEAATAATGRLVDALVTEVRVAPRDLDPYDLVARLSATAAHLNLDHSPAAAGAVFSLSARRVIVISDTWVSVDGNATFLGHAYEHLMSSVRRALTESFLAGGADSERLRREDPGRQAVVDLIRRESGLRNVDAEGDFFYATIDGRPVPRRLLAEVAVPPEARELCLASDGYPALGRTLAECEELLKRELAADPLRIGLSGGTKAVAPGADSFDDRTFVRVELGSGPDAAA